MAKKKLTGSSAVELFIPTDSQVAAYEGVFDESLTAGAAGSAGLFPFISTEDGIMKLGANVIGRELDAVILGVAVDHCLYPSDYKKGQPSAAICFYIGSSEEDAAPHATSPQPQAKTCATCVKNAFGSGRGNAKACRQSRRLLIMPLGPKDDPTTAPLYRLRVPPTSIKHVAGYKSLLDSYKRPIQSVVTHIEFSGHEQNRFEVKFKPLRPLDDRDLLQTLARRAIEGKDALFLPPLVGSGKQQTKAAPAPGGRRIVRGK